MWSLVNDPDENKHYLFVRHNSGGENRRVSGGNDLRSPGGPAPARGGFRPDDPKRAAQVFSRFYPEAPKLGADSALAPLLASTAIKGITTI